MKKERIRSQERYQKLKSGERIVGVPVTPDLQSAADRICLKRTNTLFAAPTAVRNSTVREAAEGRNRAMCHLRKLRQGVYHSKVQM